METEAKCPKCNHGRIFFNTTTGVKLIKSIAIQFGSCGNCKTRLVAEYEIVKFQEIHRSEEDIIHFLKTGKDPNKE